MYPVGQPPGPPGPGPVGAPSGPGPGPIGVPPIQVGGSGLGSTLGTGIGGSGPLGQTTLPGPLTTLGQTGLGMTGLGPMIPPGGGPGGGPQPATGLGAPGGPPGAPPALAGPGGMAPEQPIFLCPRRPNLGREGRAIMLRANHFQVSQIPLGRHI